MTLLTNDINSLIVNAAPTQASIEALGFVSGPKTVDTKLTEAEISAMGFTKASRTCRRCS